MRASLTTEAPPGAAGEGRFWGEVLWLLLLAPIPGLPDCDSVGARIDGDTGLEVETSSLDVPVFTGAVSSGTVKGFSSIRTAGPVEP